MRHMGTQKNRIWLTVSMKKERKLDTTSECREIRIKNEKSKNKTKPTVCFCFLLISRHSEVVSNFVFLR